jgi:hypothetical protein
MLDSSIFRYIHVEIPKSAEPTVHGLGPNSRKGQQNAWTLIEKQLIVNHPEHKF